VRPPTNVNKDKKNPESPDHPSEDKQKVESSETQDKKEVEEDKPKLSKEELEKQVSEGTEELIHKYLQEGPFVYELYAVMIHQGGPQSGHYYAYIKDFESKEWYKFNDTSVSKISVLDLIETFGVSETPAKGTKGRFT
jgi:ubiquitin carboxyl-terminal hydrolase 47